MSPLPDQVDALVGAVMPPSPPLPERVAIPEPLRLTSRQTGRERATVRCPDCERTFGRSQRARYELHWRLAHDVKRALP